MLVVFVFLFFCVCVFILDIDYTARSDKIEKKRYRLYDNLMFCFKVIDRYFCLL